MGEIRFRWHEDARSFLSLAPHWDRWLAAWGVDCVFLRWDWLRVWLRACRGGARLLVGVAMDGPEPIGIAPLMITSERIGPLGPVLRSVRMLGEGPLCADHLVLPVAPGREEPFARALVRVLDELRGEWDRIELKDLLEDHPAWKELERAAREAGLAPVVRPETFCPYVPLPPTWEGYLGTLGSKTRASLRSRMSRLEKEHRCEVVAPRSIEEVDLIMRDLERLHARAWEARGRPGVFADPSFRLFHRLHSRRAFRSGILWLLCLRVDGRSAAISLGYRNRTTGFAYQIGHDPALRSYGVGTLINTTAIRRAIEEGLAEVDFLRGEKSYKYHLAQRERRGLDLTIHRWTYADRAAAVAWRVRRTGRNLVVAVMGERTKDLAKRILRIR